VTAVKVAEATLLAAKAQVESDRQAVAAADAAIKQAEAAVETAKINLSYTMITSPIDGRIGRSNITEGAIATAYQALPLATVQKFDPIFVDVPQSTVELNRLRRSLAAGNLKADETDKVKIFLEDGTEYPQEGTLKFRDVTVDQTTGSVILRIVVPNPDRTLLPGMFVRVTIQEGINEQAILVLQQAVVHDHKGNPIAYIVDAESKIQQRSLTLDRAMGNQWLISSGLDAGDHVVVEGIQRIKPGASVKEVPFVPSPKEDGGEQEPVSPSATNSK
jgi:membrane fusion protein (multidrug efflux system)